jgi:nitrate reductase NapD
MDDVVHISSMIVSARPEDAMRVASCIAELPGVEVHATENGKILALAEAGSAGALGELLAAISTMERVLSANMVFECAELREVMDEPV